MSRAEVARYELNQEAWDYSERAGEMLRHEWIAERTRTLAPKMLCDLGASLGQLTQRLAAVAPAVCAVDLAPTALRRARDGLAERKFPFRSRIEFVAGSATRLPLRDESFDLVIASDGLYSWDLELPDRSAALEEIHRIVRRGGHVLFTEHVRQHRFDEFIVEVGGSKLRVLDVGYLFDRPWYQFESWLRAIRHWPVGRALRRNLTIARVLRAVGRRIGRSASRHVWVLATRA